MKFAICTIALCIAMVIGGPTFADSINAFSTCLVDNLNGKERKNLAKWMFFGIAAHPELKIYSQAGLDDIKRSDQYVGKLITRLLTVDCPNELKRAYSENTRAPEQAFAVVGKMAVQELMVNDAVVKSLTGYARYADMEKINKLLTDR